MADTPPTRTQGPPKRLFDRRQLPDVAGGLAHVDGRGAAGGLDSSPSCPQAAVFPALEEHVSLQPLRRCPDRRQAITTLPRTEMGQGITTAVSPCSSPRSSTRASTPWTCAPPTRIPAGSSSSRACPRRCATWPAPLRAAAAEARARPVTAAAHRWRVLAPTLTTAQGEVRAPDGRRRLRRAGGGRRARAAAGGPPPAEGSRPITPWSVSPRVASTHGTSSPARRAVTLDLDIPGAVPTVVARPPTLRGTVQSFDASTAPGDARRGGRGAPPVRRRGRRPDASRRPSPLATPCRSPGRPAPRPRLPTPTSGPACGMPPSAPGRCPRCSRRGSWRGDSTSPTSRTRPWRRRAAWPT